MPRYDLAGNPLPDDNPPPQQPMGGMPPPGSYPGAQQPMGGQQRYDLAGNPIATPGGMPPPAQPYGQPPGGMPPPYAPPGGAPPYGGPPPGAIQRNANGMPVIPKEDNSKQKMFVGVAAVVLLLLIGYIVFQNAVPSTVEAPKFSGTYTDPMKTFSMKQPDGWDIHSSEDVAGDPGSTDQPETTGVKFTKGTAYIDVNVEDRTKYMHTQLLTGSGTGEETFTNPGSTLDLVDRQQKHAVKAGLKNYTELGKKEVFATTWGEGHGYTFTSTGPAIGLPASIKGYRVCMMGGSKVITVVCVCRASNYDTLKKPFQDMINSIRPVDNGPAALPH